MPNHYWKKIYLTHQQVSQKIYDYVETVPMEDLLALMERKPQWKYVTDKAPMHDSMVVIFDRRKKEKTQIKINTVKK